jgi:hypothetical protein
MAEATAQIDAFNKSLATLNTTLGKFSAGSSQIGSNVSGMFAKVGQAAQQSTGIMASAGNIASSMFGSVNSRGWMRDLLMFPTRYMQSNINDNRQLALQASAGLGMQAFGANTGTQQIMGALAGQFGNVLGGSPSDLVNLMNAARQVGAGIDWSKYQLGTPAGNVTNSPRTTGFFRSVYEAQRMNPGQDVGTLAGQIGTYTSNIGAQQQSAFLTGGAFSMIGAGNQQKSISEWAEGILKWLQDLRPGADHGKAFTYPQLMSQNFPGSNIDAWLTANGVTDDMKQYFWTYALARSNQQAGGGGTIDDLFTKSLATNQSVAYNRLQASAAQTRTGFQLAGTMAGTYANKEQANKFFSELTGQLMNQVLPTAMSSGILSYMQYLPDSIQEIMNQLAERTTLGTVGAGVAGWGSMFPQLLGPGTGDAGDVGDYGSLGGTSTAGLHPDTRRKVDAMMAANPRLRVTSGFRDLGTQQRLKRQGVGRVSGRPSAHTRGMAADLGPRSEYPWIVANAKRFGLKSGNYAGEPWHVGMGDPDVGGLEDVIGNSGVIAALPGILSNMTSFLNNQFTGTISNLFGSLFGSITGSTTPADQISAIGGATSTLFQALMGIFAQGTPNQANLQYRDVYSGLVAAANSAKGIPTGTTAAPAWWQASALGGAGTAGGAFGSGGGLPSDIAAPGGPSATGGTSYDAFFSDVLRSMGAPVTRNNMDKMAAVAKYEGNVATFNPFNITSGPGTNFNSVGVRNYPNWSTGVSQLTHLFSRTDRGIPVMTANVMSDSDYTAFRDAASAFYRSWGGKPIPNISQGSADAYLGTVVKGAGDLPEMGVPPMMPGSGGAPAPIFFSNTFKIDGNSVSPGVDMRRTVNLLADQLEQEMRQRAARSN